MPLLPNEPTDPFLNARNVIAGQDAGITGFNARAIPSQSGFSTRQAKIPNERAGYHTRKLIRWFVPETGIIEMYVNPQSVSYQERKHITKQRTKGGYVLQYWGEELEVLNIQGTTGSSGVEGVNVLRDVYRAEQVAFDPFALALASDRDTENNDQFSFLGEFSEGGLGGALTGLGQSFLDLTNNAIETGSVASTRSQPTLASLAFSVEMYYSGWVFRGYFSDFRVDERADRLGLFDYAMTFNVTQRRGLRLNFLPWHRSAVNGPSNSDPDFGVPYSYSTLTSEQATLGPVVTPPNNTGVTIGDVLSSSADFIGGSFKSIFG